MIYKKLFSFWDVIDVFNSNTSMPCIETELNTGKVAVDMISHQTANLIN